jgi:hypothetical protein
MKTLFFLLIPSCLLAQYSDSAYNADKEKYLNYRNGVIEKAKNDNSAISEINAYLDISVKIVNREFGGLFSADSRGHELLKVDVLRFRDSLKNLTEVVFGDSGKILTQLARKESIYQDSIKEINTQYEKKMASCGALKIYGKVTDIDGNSVSIFGFAGSSRCDDEDFHNLRCDDEGVMGALHERSNIRILNYSPDRKTEGSLVVGEDIGVTGYRYSSKTTGTNGFGAKVRIYVYAPCNCIPSETKRDKRISDLNDKANSLFSEIGMTKGQLEEIINKMSSISLEKLRNF